METDRKGSKGKLEVNYHRHHWRRQARPSNDRLIVAYNTGQTQAKSVGSSVFNAANCTEFNRMETFTPKMETFTLEMPTFTPKMEALTVEITTFTREMETLQVEMETFTPEMPALHVQMETFTPRKPTFTRGMETFTVKMEVYAAGI